MAYDLTRLGPTHFTQLCEALFVHIFGPGVSISSSPLRQWDAEFEGTRPSLDENEPWSGLAVLDVMYFYDKSKQPERSLHMRIHHMLSKVHTAKEHYADTVQTPDYIVIATNLKLPATGGKFRERLDSMISDYAHSIPLRGWSIWDYDEISRLLDSNVEVRTAFVGELDYIVRSFTQPSPSKVGHFSLSPLGDNPSASPHVSAAWWRLVSTRESVNGLFEAYSSLNRQAADVTSEDGRDIEERRRDLLRAAIVFTSAGVDACLGALLRHAVPALATQNESSRRRFDLFLESQTRDSKTSHEFLDALKSDNPRQEMLKLYIASIVRASFQGSDSLKKRALSSLGISNQQIDHARLIGLDSFFAARNEVAHRLDLLDVTEDEGRPVRRPRELNEVGPMCNDALILVRDIIRATAINLDDCE